MHAYDLERLNLRVSISVHTSFELIVKCFNSGRNQAICTQKLAGLERIGSVEIASTIRCQPLEFSIVLQDDSRRVNNLVWTFCARVLCSHCLCFGHG